MCMCLKLMEEGRPLTKVVCFDTGMEYKAIYRNIEKIKPMLEAYGCELVILKSSRDFLVDMLLKPVNKGKANEHYGYDWCGGCARWRTADKRDAIDKYLRGLGEYTQYLGIAADEPARVKQEKNKEYPLVEWGMTEKDCLEFCYSRGWSWMEDGVELYSILDRVSCWCCANKNLKELRNMYHYLPEYWGLLKGLQSRIDRPFRRSGLSIFELEERFQKEDKEKEEAEDDRR